MTIDWDPLLSVGTQLQLICIVRCKQSPTETLLDYSVGTLRCGDWTGQVNGKPKLSSIPSITWVQDPKTNVMFPDFTGHLTLESCRFDSPMHQLYHICPDHTQCIAICCLHPSICSSSSCWIFWASICRSLPVAASCGGVQGVYPS